MAEPLGVVASGIAVAQLGIATGGAILKLKQLWDQVNDAPETISDLIERIDLIYPSVWDFEQQCSQYGLPPTLWDNTTATRSLAYCRKALKKLSDIVDAFAAQIATRRGFRQRLVAFKVVLKKDELKRLEEQLRNSLEVLRYAQDAYTRAMLIATPDIVALKLLQQPLRSNLPTASLQNFNDESTSPTVCESDEETQTSIAVSRTTRPKYQRAIKAWDPWSSFGNWSIHTGPQEVDAEFRPPWWLAGLASSFYLHMHKQNSAWDVQLRLYLDRPDNDPVFLMAEYGDIVGLQALFDQRKASPFDRDENGGTLLHYTISWNQLEATKFLIEMGADLTETTRLGHRPTDIVGQYSIARSEPDAGLELARFLLPKIDMTESTSELSELHCECPYTVFWDVFQHLQPLLCPHHHETTLQSRLYKLQQYDSADVQIHQFLLDPEWTIDPDTLCNEAWTVYGVSLLHHLVDSHRYLRVIVTTAELKLHKFTADIMRMTADLHPYELASSREGACRELKVDITPFIRLIMELLEHNFEDYLTAPVRAINELQRWVQDLVKADVDIEEYGSVEQDILRSIKAESRTSFKIRTDALYDIPSGLRGYEICLYDFTYGPNVEDWTILCNEPTDEFVGEFWDLVEDRPLDMPGAWFD
ncbi:Transcriptional regulatory protein Pro-1 [Apiospora arundinis]